MIEIRRILCPIDFSGDSRRALDHAVAIAHWYDAKVTVLHVSSIPVSAYAAASAALGPVGLSNEDRRELVEEMKAFVEAESSSRIATEAVVREGTAADEIVAEAKALKADLIVIGTHGRSGFERFLLGSVTERVLRTAPCPVLTVPLRHPDAVPAGRVLYKRILCPVDFSDSSLYALDYAVSLAQEAHGDLTLLHVLSSDAQDRPDVASADELQSLAAYERDRESSARRLLEHAVPDAADSECRIDALMASGTPSREILRIAADRRAELIVIGVQGRGAADLMFFGSTTQAVVREAHCPVLTIRRV